jgi:DNA-binding IclR family transcriptional regulator
MPGVRCIAAAIHFGNEIVGSIGISAPASRFAKNAIPEYAEKVRSVANRIGEHLAPAEPKA